MRAARAPHKSGLCSLYNRYEPVQREQIEGNPWTSTMLPPGGNTLPRRSDRHRGNHFNRFRPARQRKRFFLVMTWTVPSAAVIPLPNLDTHASVSSAPNRTVNAV